MDAGLARGHGSTGWAEDILDYIILHAINISWLQDIFDDERMKCISRREKRGKQKKKKRKKRRKMTPLSFPLRCPAYVLILIRASRK